MLTASVQTAMATILLTLVGVRSPNAGPAPASSPLMGLMGLSRRRRLWMTNQVDCHSTRFDINPATNILDVDRHILYCSSYHGDDRSVLTTFVNGRLVSSLKRLSQLRFELDSIRFALDSICAFELDSSSIRGSQKARSL